MAMNSSTAHLHCSQRAPYLTRARVVAAPSGRPPVPGRTHGARGRSLHLPFGSADDCCVFDMAYFGGTFAEGVRDFSHDHDDANVRLALVTQNGERLDALHLRADETGASISTRDDRLIFLPYSLIAYVDVAILQDYRVAGFQLAVGS